MWRTFATACADNCGLLNYRLSLLWLVDYPAWMPREPYAQGAVIYAAILAIAALLFIAGAVAARHKT